MPQWLILIPVFGGLFALHYFIWRKTKITQELINPCVFHLTINNTKREARLSYSNAITHELMCRTFALDVVRVHPAGTSPPSINIRASGFGEPLSVDIYLPAGYEPEYTVE